MFDNQFIYLGSDYEWVIWTILAVIVVVFLRRLITVKERRSMPSIHKAMGVLQERYAKGEISHEEYEERMRKMDGK